MSAPESLERLFAAWRSEAPPVLPPIGAEVRRRTAALAPNKIQLPWTTRIEQVFSRPSFGVVFVAACILFGLFVAELRLSRLETERLANIERSYLQLINPLIADAAGNHGNQTP